MQRQGRKRRSLIPADGIGKIGKRAKTDISAKPRFRICCRDGTRTSEASTDTCLGVGDIPNDDAVLGPKVIRKPILLTDISYPSLGKRMSKAAMNNRLVGKAKHGNCIYYNDRPGTFTVNDVPMRRNNLNEMLGRYPTHKMAAMSLDELTRTVSPTMQYVSFLLYPNKWIEDSDRTLETYKEMVDSFQLSDKDDDMYLNKKRRNTRLTEQQTMFPCVNDEHTSLVVIGDPNVICSSLDGSLSFPESANRTIHNIFGIKQDVKVSDVKRNIKRSNDYPVLVALEPERLIECDGKVYKISLFEKTKARGNGIVPTLLTSNTEVLYRIQASLVGVLMKCNLIKLDPKPVDESKSLYKLSDDDKLSAQFRLYRSDSIMFQVYIHCPVCLKIYNHLWVPNDDERVEQNLDRHKCENCDCRLLNGSCFVLNEATARQSLDPSSLRKIHWDVPRKQKSIPEGFRVRKEDLPKYQQVLPTVCPSSLKIHAHDDFERKNQRTSAIAITLFIPTAYSTKENAKLLKEQLSEMGMTTDEIDLKRVHKVRLFCFHNGMEHDIDVSMTRMKVSIACNKTINLNIKDEQKMNLLRREFVRFDKCMKFGSCINGETSVSMAIPSVQCTKRIGVETVDGAGKIVRHKTSVLMAPSSRRNSKRQPQIQVEEWGPMYSATNFWQHPIVDAGENFHRYGVTLIGGLVNNLCKKGLVAIGDEEINMFSVGGSDWFELNEVNASPTDEVRELWRRKMTKSLRILDEKLKENEKDLKKKERKLLAVNKSGALCDAQTKIKELEDEIARLKGENSELLRENRYLKMSLKRIECRHEEMVNENKELRGEMMVIKEKSAKSEAKEKKLTAEILDVRGMHIDLAKQFEKLEQGFDSRLEMLMKKCLDRNESGGKLDAHSVHGQEAVVSSENRETRDCTGMKQMIDIIETNCQGIDVNVNDGNVQYDDWDIVGGWDVFEALNEKNDNDACDMSLK